MKTNERTYMKLLKYLFILLAGITLGVFIGCTLSAYPHSEEVCKEFKQIDWYDGGIRYTYVPELNQCYKR